MEKEFRSQQLPEAKAGVGIVFKVHSSRLPPSHSQLHLPCLTRESASEILKEGWTRNTHVPCQPSFDSDAFMALVVHDVINGSSGNVLASIQVPRRLTRTTSLLPTVLNLAHSGKGRDLTHAHTLL